ncbi:MAG: hypoxanthine phosphoribosyltransferase [Kiritimatiellaeota bacterium]|nr:hypoxanthine phosphoribosyltransferase [Kiritimatiellota bacterium]
MQPHHIRNVLLTEEQIRQRVGDLVREMAGSCRGDNVVLIGILRGSFMFLADLVRALYRQGVRPRIDFMTLESYGAGLVSTGAVRVTKDLGLDVTGAEVLVVDDILDTGRTLSFARQHLLALGARAVRTCVLLDKPARRVAPFHADQVGFTIEDRFVVGYGLDYDSHYRELPYIACVTLLDSAGV